MQKLFFSWHKKALAWTMSPFARSLQKNSPESFGALVGEGGFGPPKLKSNRFTVCPLWPLGNSPILNWFGGAGGRTRTPDLLITNQLLYQLSYTSFTDYNIISHLRPLVKSFLKFFQKTFCRKWNWSRRQDSNLRHLGPKPSTLPNWATPRSCLFGVHDGQLLNYIKNKWFCQ